MTEPKKEKCEACFGSGYINFRTDDGHISMRTCRRCDGCGYIKVVPMTNEEWLKQANTEQLAEWFINSGFLTCTLRDCEDCKYYDKNNDDCIDGSEAIADKQMWVEWLKQPHTEKE